MTANKAHDIASGQINELWQSRQLVTANPVNATMIKLVKRTETCASCHKLITPIKDKYAIHDYLNGLYYHLRCFQKRNPEERIRPLVGGMTASERKMVREAEETEIRDWLRKIQSADTINNRRAVIKDMINEAKKEQDSIRVVGEVIKRGRLHEEIESMRLRKLLNPSGVITRKLTKKEAINFFAAQFEEPIHLKPTNSNHTKKTNASEKIRARLWKEHGWI